MVEPSKDAVINAINNGIRRGIQVAIDNGCLGSAIILIFSGMDAMAFLGMPEGQEDVSRADFISWANRYVRFPCREQLSGADMYGARCGMLHNYSAYSRMTRNGECRIVGYMDKSVPEVRYNSGVSKELVLVSVPALAEAFFRGVDQFLIDLFSDGGRAQLGEERLRKLVHCLPYDPGK